ncbi:MAG: NAD-dependent epimerase/dehydratase family protein [Terriglobia bacterium]|jgi:nucleoside-diphosphate-sugar epimerase
MRVLLTGGGGYIGSVLVGHLLRKAHMVTVLDNLLYGVHGLYQYCAERSFDFVRGDVRDEGLMRSLIADKDIILPLAALVGMPACVRDPIYATTTNCEAIALMNRLRSREQRVIYPCTNSGYGTKTGDVYCTEETPLEPISIYGKTKVDAEKLLLDSPNAVSLRLATVFGVSPRMRLDLLVNDFTYRAVKDRFLVLYEKDFKRNYLHIEDVARAFCHVIENFEAMKGEAYNVGLDDANLSKEELALKIKEYVPELYIHAAEVASDPDKRNYIVSNTKIARHGFVATHSLDEGIQELLKGYRMMGREAHKNA